jgi:serine/threonine-protein kinase
MGEVYLAEDTRLKRSVAIKRLAPTLQADERYHRRFLKEAERASALNHPNIAAIHDAIEEKGEILLVMEHIEGDTLRQYMKEPLSLETFYPIALQCAEGLAAAHERGIIHGDIKPENIMLTAKGRVKILDFGVARRMPVLEESAATKSAPSISGEISGTPAYMAPEVLLSRASDGRADIFSLGVVFYEMLSGENPFQAATFLATADCVLHHEPASLMRRGIPAEIDGLIAKMLVKDPVRRCVTAASLGVDLRAAREGTADGLRPLASSWKAVAGRRTRAAIAAVAVVIGGLLFWHLRSPSISGVPSQPKLAVLAFSSTDNTPESQVVGKGIRETLGARLARLGPNLCIIPPVVTNKKLGGWEDTRVDSPSAALEAGANLALQGSVHIAENQVRVSYTLTNLETSKVLNGDIVDGDRGNLYGIEDSVTRSVLTILQTAPGAQPLSAPSRTAGQIRAPASQRAYEPYLEGRGYLQDASTVGEVEEAVGSFKRSITLDPNFTLAYAGLGDAYWRAYQLTRLRTWVDQSIAACSQAVSLDQSVASGHACLGNVYQGTGKYEEAARQYQDAAKLDPARDDVQRELAYTYELMGKPEEAENTYRRAINLRPDLSRGYSWLGVFYLNQAQYPKAEEMFRKAIQLAPANFRDYANLGGALLYQDRAVDAIPMFERSMGLRPTAEASSNLATAYFTMHRYTDAARTYEKAVKLDPLNYEVWGNLGDAYYWAPGQRSEAPQAYRKAISLAEEKLKVNARDANLLGYLAGYYAMLGDRAHAVPDLNRALNLAPKNPELLFNAALVHSQLGDTSLALDWLGKALAAGYSRSVVASTPNFENLNTNSRYQKLMQPH